MKLLMNLGEVMPTRAAAVLACALALLGGAAPAQAGRLVVGGDITWLFTLTDDAPNAADPGDGTFLTNILGAGTEARVLLTSVNPGTQTEPISFLTSLPGVNASYFNGPVTDAKLAGVDLFLVPLLDHTADASEVSAISSFLAAGGTLLLMSDTNSVPVLTQSVADTNALLAALGSTISITGAVLDIGSQTATGSAIAVTPLTAGVTSFTYGSTSIVTGGTPLLYTKNGSTMMAYDGLSAVPEPATLTLCGAGLAALLLTRRRPSSQN